MPSRRITAPDALAPNQEVNVNPYSSYNSDNVNGLTRIITGEAQKDFVIAGLDTTGTPKYYYRTATGEVLESPARINETFTNLTNWDSEYASVNSSKCLFQIPAGSTSVEGWIKRKTGTITISDVGSWFKIKFDVSNLSSAEETPTTITVLFGNNSYTYNYPCAGSYEVYLQLVDFYNQTGEENNLKISVVLDDLNPYSCHAIFIDNVSLERVVTRSQRITAITDPDIKPTNIPEAILHPHKILQVSKGVAIKDEAVVTLMGISDTVPISILTYSDPNSWIKGNPYTAAEFNGTSYYSVNNIFTSVGFDANGVLLTSPLDDGDNDLGAVIEAVLVGDSVDHFNIVSGGSGYSVMNDGSDPSIPPFLIFKGGGGSGAEAIAITDYDGVITGVNLINGGSGYTEAPTVIVGTGRKINGDTRDPLNSYYPTVQWAYICMYYSYYKNPSPNKAYIGLVRPEDVNDSRYGEDYLVLGLCRMIDAETCDAIFYYPDGYQQRKDWGYIDATRVTYKFLSEMLHWDNRPANVSLALDMLANRIFNYKSLLYFPTHQHFVDWRARSVPCGTGHGPQDYKQWKNGMYWQNGFDLVAYVIETGTFWRSKIRTQEDNPDYADLINNERLQIDWYEITHKRFEVNWSEYATHASSGTDAIDWTPQATWMWYNGTGSIPADSNMVNSSYFSTIITNSSSSTKDLDQAKAAWPSQYYVVISPNNEGCTIVNPFNEYGSGSVPGPTTDDILYNRFLRADNRWREVGSVYNFFIQGFLVGSVGSPTDIGQIVIEKEEEVLNNMTVAVDTLPAGGSISIKLYKKTRNGLNTAWTISSVLSTCTIAPGSGSGKVNTDIFTPVTFNRGELLLIRCDGTGVAPDEGGADTIVSVYFQG